MKPLLLRTGAGLVNAQVLRFVHTSRFFLEDLGGGSHELRSSRFTGASERRCQNFYSIFDFLHITILLTAEVLRVLEHLKKFLALLTLGLPFPASSETRQKA